MTAKADFTEEEWGTIVGAPLVAGMMVVTASGGGTLRETFAFARAWTDARGQHGASPLLDDIVAEKPTLDRHRYGDAAELRAQGQEQLAAARALLAEKATPEELDTYRAFVLDAAQRVATAHKEGGQEVSPEEQAALDEIRYRLT
jgi:hypothetical protein